MNYHGAKAFILAKLKKELPSYLSYHCLDHTLDVWKTAKQLCHYEQVSPGDTLLVLTAALFHDSGFIINPKNHEQLSCQIAAQHLPHFGYSSSMLDQIQGMIMATKIPQSPSNPLEAILCDADLDYLGRDDFYTIGPTLFEELQYFGVLQTTKEWNQLQVNFLASHFYHTTFAQLNRQATKLRHLNELKMIIEQV